LKTSDFSDGLVTESPLLNTAYPGIGKFLLGTWLLADQGHIFTLKDLLDRFQATAIEHMGRCKLNPEDFFLVLSKKTPMKMELDAGFLSLKASHLTKRKISSIILVVLGDYIKKSVMDIKSIGW
jgi:hypothetical protein